MAFQEHGLDRLRAAVEKNVEQAARVAARVRREPELELTAPAPLNVVTFRYRGRGLPDAQLDALNAEVVMRIQESGVAVPSTTRLRGRTVIRLAIVNHRSVDEDFDVLVDAVLETGRAVAAQSSGSLQRCLTPPLGRQRRQRCLTPPRAPSGRGANLAPLETRCAIGRSQPSRTPRA